MKIEKEIIIKDAKSISEVLDEILYKATFELTYQDQLIYIKSSIETLSNLLRKSK